MKLKLIALIFGTLSLGAFAQTAEKDTVIVRKSKTFTLKIGEKDSLKTKEIKPSSKFSVQLTLARIDLGLTKMLDNGSFTLSPQNDVLESQTWKSTNFGFEFFQMGYRFNHNFKVYLGGGVDWAHFRLKKNITIQPDKSEFTYVNEPIEFSKNRFSSTYLRIPLSFQFRTNDDHKGNKVYVIAGPEIGFLVNGKVKQVSDERGKEKVKDDFNLNPFRYGASVRLGYGDFGIYTKYYANDIFADNQGPAELKNLSFGIMLGF